MNNELMYGYVDNDTRDFMAYEMAVDVELDKAHIALEMADRRYELALKQSDLKVLTEGGTYDDTSALYEAAAKDNKEASEGILTKAIRAVRNFITNIINKIKSLFGDEEEKGLQNADPNKTVTIKGNPQQHINSLNKTLSDYAAFLKPGFHATDEDGNKVFSITKTIVTGLEAVGAAAAIKFGGGKIVGFIKGYRHTEEKANDMLNEAEKTAASINDDAQKKVLDGVVQGIRNVAASAQKGFQSVFNAAKGIINLDKFKKNKNTGAAGQSEPQYDTVDEEKAKKNGFEAEVESADDDLIGDADTILESCEDIIALLD